MPSVKNVRIVPRGFGEKIFATPHSSEGVEIEAAPPTESHTNSLIGVGDGTRGVSFYVGYGVPGDDLNIADGDSYLDASTALIWGRVDGDWQIRFGLGTAIVFDLADSDGITLFDTNNEPLQTSQIGPATDNLTQYVLKAGDTMTGPLVLSGAPSQALHAATKSYVDAGDALALPKAGGTMTGALTLSGTPTQALQAATKAYVDSAVSGSVGANYVLKAGDTMTGALTLSGAPTLALQAATKAYVDTGVATSVAKAGDTMTGFLTLSADPTQALHAATKAYVDAAISALESGGGVTPTGDSTVLLEDASGSFLLEDGTGLIILES